MHFSDSFLYAFRVSLEEWFGLHGRKLPWRGISDPYRIWVSEIILQQTQVKQGWDYYLRFIDAFPDVSSLAGADESRLLRVWQGLGYYSRALNMKVAANQILDRFGGRFPDNAADISSLKGIGPYTTSAIGSIAYGLPLAVLDGNVYRVLSRLLLDMTPIDTTGGKKHFAELASLLLDPDNPSLYNQAIMDLGAMVCTPARPKCEDCPIRTLCKSAGTEYSLLLPLKSRKLKVKEETMHFYLLQRGTQFAIEKRDRSGIWKGLYQLPILSDVPVGWSEKGAIRLKDHRLTHRLLHIEIHLCLPDSVECVSSLPYLFIEVSDHSSYPFPKPLRQFLDTHFPV